MKIVLELAVCASILATLGCNSAGIPNSIVASGSSQVEDSRGPLPPPSPETTTVQKHPTPKILTDEIGAIDAARKLFSQSEISDLSAKLTKVADLKGNQRITGEFRYELDASLWLVAVKGRLNARSYAGPDEFTGPEARILLSPEDLSTVSVDLYQSPIRP